MDDFLKSVAAGVVVSVISTLLWREMMTGFWRTQYYWGSFKRHMKKEMKEAWNND